MSMEVLVTFSKSHNHSRVSQREIISPSGILLWPSTQMLFLHFFKKRQNKTNKGTKTMSPQNLVLGLEDAAVKFVLKQWCQYRVFSQNIHCRLLTSWHVQVVAGADPICLGVKVDKSLAHHRAITERDNQPSAATLAPIFRTISGL